MAEEVVQISRQDPAIEAYRLGLLGDVQQYIKDQIAAGMPAETAYKIAGLTAPESAAISAAGSGIGAYQPFLQAGEAAIQGGQNILTGSAMPSLQQAEATTGASQNIINQAAQLAGAQRAVPYTYQQAAAQTAAGIGSFNPFEEQVVQQSLNDIARQRDLAQQGLRAQSVGAGAFGGSRQAVAEQELGRNALEQMGRTSGQLRQAGFDATMARRMQEAQLYGDLGIQYGQLGQQDVAQLGDLAQNQLQLGQGLGSLSAQYGQYGSALGQLGVQQAGIGEIGQNVRTSQIGNALSAGNLQRGIDQSALDATRLTNVQAQQYPYQQYGFLSDIYAGIPTSQSTITASSAPQVSPFQTALGLGISGLSAAAGASKAGLL
jgi:hypothetical protein|tara:strand:- start:776 stop:1903 length:1128 start_codon:yes stop_codon:yes gene_type:complete